MKMQKGILKAVIAFVVALTVILSGTAMSVNFSENQNIGGTLANTIVSISPSSQTVEKGETFNVSVYIELSEPTIGVTLDLHFDPDLIHANLVTEGNLFNDSYDFNFYPGIIDNDAGTITDIQGFPIGGAVENPGVFCNIEFTAQQQLGTSALNLENVVVASVDGGPLPLEVNNGEVTIGENTPEISDVVLIASEPLDTDFPFGWENVSCTVTDVVGIGEVKLIVTWPDDNVVEYPMTKLVETDTYYVKTTFTDEGCYHYYVWADDIYNSDNTSSLMQFELPPNEDVDMNGQIHFMDLIAVVLMYGDYGPPGWCREDVDNNGQVHFMDLVEIVVPCYGCYW